jgi:serine/threonine protein kinase
MKELEGMQPLIERYRIHRELGRGGLGTVYLAEDQRSGTMQVIKLIKDIQGGNANQFLREAQAAARIEHPNVARIINFGRVESGCYIVTPFLEGDTLRKLIESGKLEPKEAISIAIQVAKGLGAAHKVGVVHRDLKPENIFVNQRGYVTLTDFGIAKRIRDLTTPGVVLGKGSGSIGYMSPEQLQGIGSPRSDLWSLGVVLYEMASQHSPFEEGSPVATMASILKKDVPKRILAPELERIVTKALQKPEEKRYQTAEEMAHDLEKLEKDILQSGTESDESQIGAAKGSFFERMWGRRKKEIESVVLRGGDEISGEKAPPTTLYINLWIEDESNETVKLPARLKFDATYNFMFAIERWSREGNAMSEGFVEPPSLREQEKSLVVIELLCPFLVTKDESGYIRREVEYIAGFGFKPVPFPLKPGSIGSFFLTARLIVKGETVYREVLPLEVLKDDTFESFTADTFAVATQEN